ncbi:MAG TPA: WecB/TagA/CpsF family glycosyltransferase [Candidatus Dormibacteraeota bacterium]|nr:WecB/TagA/CpsF family glycosyltransferase [Candidatus Dormibacteraeota bacterium]
MRVLGVGVDLVDMETALDALTRAAGTERAGAPLQVVTLNPEMVMRARRDPALGAIIEAAGMVVPDGIGLVLSMRRRGHRTAVRVTGADLLELYAERAAPLGHRLALVGGEPGVAEGAAAELRRRHPGLTVVAADAGDPGGATAERLRAAAPDAVFAAYGAGRQESFLAAHLAGTGAGVGMGVGGALDFLSGRVRRAPAAVRRAGLEWAWRLARQPWRVRRQAVLPLFWWLDRRECAALATSPPPPRR